MTKILMMIEKRKVKGQVTFTLTRTHLCCGGYPPILGKPMKYDFPTLEAAVSELRWWEMFDKNPNFVLEENP